jgi:benzoyl-CoA-dihydrodiol lyase
MARELDDAILSLRTNELTLGTWVLKTSGDAREVLAVDGALARHEGHWFVRQTLGMVRRTLARLDVSSRSLIAVLDKGSCFAGTLAELAFAADRSYMAAHEGDAAEPRLTLSEMSFGPLPLVTGQSRLGRRFYEEGPPLAAAREAIGKALTPREAEALGLVTACPDELDWTDEVRIAIEERAAMSPDALTGLEANLRFNGKETMLTRIFGRLSAWQNWIFVRPNAVGEKGALKVYGKGEKAQFDRTRV